LTYRRCFKAPEEDEFEPAFASIARLKADALIVGTDPFFTSRRERIVALTSGYPIPAIHEWQESSQRAVSSVKAANALGLAVPPTLLTAADKVIE